MSCQLTANSGLDATGISSKRACDIDTDLVWSARVGAGIRATPLITDLHRDGVKDIVIATTSHFIESISGSGKKTQGSALRTARWTLRAR